jgi:PIN domain nuclease of toxin-antitoxin system
MLVSPARFSRSTVEALENPDNELFLSAASSWEIAIKHSLGRLELPEPPSEFVPSRMARSGVIGLAVEHRHALTVADLPPHHRDPFDRLLVAQALVESLPILTADPQLSRYGVETLPI